MITRCDPRAGGSLLILLAVVVLLPLAVCVRIGLAETPEEAIRRIQAGRHTPMPPPTTAPASGPAGKGMTIENGTGHTLHVHFSGPVSRTVVVSDGTSESVELAVGDYQVAAEVPASRIIPFFGRQAYQAFTHYWLKFYTQRVDAPGRRPASPDPPRPSPPSPGYSGVDIPLDSQAGQRTHAAATYRSFCAICHGQTGAYGVASIYLNPRPTEFQRKSRDELRQMIREGRGAMPPWQHLPSAQIDELVDYVISVAGSAAASHPGFEKEKATTLLKAHRIDQEPEYVLEILRQNGWAKLIYPDRPGVCIELNADKSVRTIPLPASDHVDLSTCPRQ